MDLRRRETRSFFRSRLLETLLRPVLDDLGRLVRAVLSRLGLAGGVELERKLRVARPGVEPSQFFGEKVAAALIGIVIFPFMNVLGVHPFGPWPVWAWLVGAAVGFVGPDWQLERHLSARPADRQEERRLRVERRRFPDRVARDLFRAKSLIDHTASEPS